MDVGQMRSAERVGIAGFGTVGREITRQIQNEMPEYAVTAVSAKNWDPAEAYIKSQAWDFPVVAVSELSKKVDLVIESAPATIFRDIAEPVLRAGKTLVVLSSGALLANWDLVDLASEFGGRIAIPSGALLGLDTVQATAQGRLDKVTMATRKPPGGLQDAPYVLQEGLDLSGLKEPMLLFRGTAREAAAGFPANLNVAVALSLAGLGPDQTTLEVWADPTVDKNTHSIKVESDSALLTMQIENIPTENLKTGRVTALSVIALLKKRAATLAIGT